VDRLLSSLNDFHLFRAWSNYKAYKASDYLESLIAAIAIKEDTSPILTEYYTTPSPSSPSPYGALTPLNAANTPSSPESTLTSGRDKENHKSTSSPSFSVSDLLIQEGTIPELITALELPKENGGELVNAVCQVRARLGLPKALKAAGAARMTSTRGKQEEAVTSSRDRRRV
jgi:hypothetical protein